MLEFAIPGYKTLQLHHLVVDYNGTLARDGDLLEGVEPLLEALSNRLQLHLLTADTFGKAQLALAIPSKTLILPAEQQAIGKLRYVEQLGCEQVVCIGNGRNDQLMLKAAALGIAVVQTEGTAVEALMAADIVVPSIHDALSLLVNPLRLIATLRA